MQLSNQIILVIEVAIDGAGSDSGFLGDFGARQAMKTPFTQHLVGCIEDDLFLVVTHQNELVNERSFILGGEEIKSRRQHG